VKTKAERQAGLARTEDARARIDARLVSVGVKVPRPLTLEEEQSCDRDFREFALTDIAGAVGFIDKATVTPEQDAALHEEVEELNEAGFHEEIVKLLRDGFSRVAVFEVLLRNLADLGESLTDKDGDYDDDGDYGTFPVFPPKRGAA
jgi:hypothetical protein